MSAQYILLDCMLPSIAQRWTLSQGYDFVPLEATDRTPQEEIATLLRTYTSGTFVIYPGVSYFGSRLYQAGATPPVVLQQLSQLLPAQRLWLRFPFTTEQHPILDAEACFHTLHSWNTNERDFLELQEDGAYDDVITLSADQTVKLPFV